jgi:hypothetical protein
MDSSHLFNELTHKWLDIVRHYYLHALPLTNEFHQMDALYTWLLRSLDLDKLLQFQKLIRDEGF